MPKPDLDMDVWFAAARHAATPELPTDLRRQIIAAADHQQRPSRASSIGRTVSDRLAGLLSRTVNWRPAGVLAAFAFLGFGFGSVFADNAEILASGLLTAEAETSGVDIFSDLEQLLLEG